MTDAIPQHPPTYWGLVEHRAADSPDRPLLSDEHGRTLTCAGYRDEAERVAAGLHDLGVRAGTVVSWQLPTAIDSFVLLAALTRLGAVQNPIVPIMREREVRYITHEAKTEYFLVRPEWRGFAYGALAEEIAGEIGCTVLASDTLPTGDPSVLPPPPEPERVRRWLYHTSGSTSDPKGAWHADTSVIASMYAFVTRILPTPDDVYPICFPVTHIGGAAMLGAALHVGLPPAAGRGVRRRADARSSWPSRAPRCSAPRCRCSRRTWPRSASTATSRCSRGCATCVGGGAPKTAGIDDVIRARARRARRRQQLGPDRVPDRHQRQRRRHAGADRDHRGSAVARRRAPRRRPPTARECGPGEEGELRLRGPHLFLGYANPELDADALDEQGYFRTGDLGIVADTGHVTITGRLKDIIIRNAENISAERGRGDPAPPPRRSPTSR